MSQDTGSDIANNHPNGRAFDRVLAAGRNLWLAGVGAVAEVSEGGVEMFDRLVERGKPLEARQKQVQKKVMDAVAERATKLSREAGKLVQDTVEFESRGVLKRLNVLTREDVKVLNARISTLTSKVDEVVARRFAPVKGQPKSAKTVEIVDPSGETAAVVIPVTSAATRSKAAQPAQKKATR
jgi:poly(hydroxyalkanoate) granule-associated protein